MKPLKERLKAKLWKVKKAAFNELVEIVEKLGEKSSVVEVKESLGEDVMECLGEFE